MQKQTIALIDDDRNILTSLSIALEKEGFKVQTYIDGESALIGLTRMPPDLAVIDIKMPKMDGEELLKKLRKKTSLPVIFLTSKDDEIDELLGLKLGADDFVKKSGGFSIISYPTENCFPEWKDTCRKIDIEYSGLNFLCSKELLKDFKSTEIHYSEQFNYLENFEDVYKLFRSIINVGAQSTNCKHKTVKELKKIQKFWPKNYNNTVNLSWQIEIQIIKKL